jgi:aspartyl-tRNA(Asn)/glutamyl-tRNA(Gln) amidotransferase subunit C
VKITTQDVKNVAALAHLDLDETEIEGYSNHFNSILGYIEQISEVEAKAPLSPSSEPVLTPVREDENNPSFTVDQALANAPERYEDFFLVPKVLE